jgi:3-phosphoshikimate 1-carboxyvinyltransferase
MPLPDLIEVVPLAQPVHAQVTVPGSKSITNRALLLGALAAGVTELRGALWSEDTEVMVACLRQLGFEVGVASEPDESCNRTITVHGRGGVVPPGGTRANPLELFVGNAGTAARFLTAFVCLGNGVYRLKGVPRMHERPQAELFDALRQLGYTVTAENGNERLPGLVEVEKTDARAKSGRRSCSVRIESSSQFASALLLCAGAGGWHVEVLGESAEESPYVAMTTELVKVFPRNGGSFDIEADASSGTYFLAADWLSGGAGKIAVKNWPRSGWQIDQNFREVMGKAMARAGATTGSEGAREPHVISRNRDLGDGIMTAIVMAAQGLHPVRFTDLGRLRLQECERVAALRTELTRCGAKVIEEGDSLTVYPSELHGAEIETYNDHRMAMCFAILGLAVPGIRLRNPACVKKTFPNFFQKLAAAPPQGLGVRLLDGGSGGLLREDGLLA